MIRLNDPISEQVRHAMHGSLDSSLIELDGSNDACAILQRSTVVANARESVVFRSPLNSASL